MAKKHPPYGNHTTHQHGDSSEDLVALAHEAVDAFRKENPKAHRELVSAFEGESADVALFGHGRFHVSVKGEEIEINPGRVRGKASTGRGAIAPETLVDIAEGRLTPLEAFFKGDLIARARSDDLHRVYNYFVEYSDAALRSGRLQKVLEQFREKYTER